MKAVLLFILATVLGTGAYAFDLMAWSMDATFHKKFELVAFDINTFSTPAGKLHFHGSCQGEALKSSNTFGLTVSQRMSGPSEKFFTVFGLDTTEKCHDLNFNQIDFRKTVQDTYQVNLVTWQECRYTDPWKCRSEDSSGNMQIFCRVTWAVPTLLEGEQPTEVTCNLPENQGWIKFKIQLDHSIL